MNGVARIVVVEDEAGMSPRNAWRSMGCGQTRQPLVANSSGHYKGIQDILDAFSPWFRFPGS